MCFVVGFRLRWRFLFIFRFLFFSIVVLFVDRFLSNKWWEGFGVFFGRLLVGFLFVLFVVMGLWGGWCIGNVDIGCSWDVEYDFFL